MSEQRERLLQLSTQNPELISRREQLTPEEREAAEAYLKQITPLVDEEIQAFLKGLTKHEFVNFLHVFPPNEQFQTYTYEKTATGGHYQQRLRIAEAANMSHILVRNDQFNSGGMGIIVRGYDMDLHRSVAMKRLTDAKYADVDSANHLRYEAQSQAHAQSYNVLTIYELMETPQGPIVVLPYMDPETSPTLAQAFKEDTPFSAQERLDTNGQRVFAPDFLRQFMRDMESAFTVIHVDPRTGKKRVHSDFKPGNIFLTEFGARVADFGLASDVIEKTNTQDIGFGTPSYSAPEVFNGEERTIPTDLYAIGLVLYRMMFGETLYTGSNVMSIFSSAYEFQKNPAQKLDSALLAEYCKKFGLNKDAVLAFFLKALASKREDRFSDIQAMNRAFQAAFS